MRPPTRADRKYSTTTKFNEFLKVFGSEVSTGWYVLKKGFWKDERNLSQAENEKKKGQKMSEKKN